MAKHLFINFSDTPMGSTRDMIDAEIDKLPESPDEIKIAYLGTVQGCINCHNRPCEGQDRCLALTLDRFNQLLDVIGRYSIIHFCFPVYCNAPSHKFINFISRASMINNGTTYRNLFNGKPAYIHTIADVSGTQSAAMIAMSQLNMVGFTIPPRAVKEYISNWSDLKIRGGNPEKKAYMPSHYKNFETEKGD